MKNVNYILSLLALTLLWGCVTEFTPEIEEEDYTLVIEGMITDLNEPSVIKIKWSKPLNTTEPPPSSALFTVRVSDDTGEEWLFRHSGGGLYVSDTSEFKPVSGKRYSVELEGNGHRYASEPAELIPVPPIDSLPVNYIFNEFYIPGQVTPGYQVSVSTYDPTGNCRFFRWTYDETWEFRLPWDYPTLFNRICWKSAASTGINTLSTSTLSESRVSSQPVTFITGETDRVTARYSINVKQYSLGEDEFIYWENVRQIAFDAGGLYDVIPSNISGNLYCIDDPSVSVLGYVSVSSVAEKRIFIENRDLRFPPFYEHCPFDTILTSLWNPAIHTGIYILTEWTPDPPGNIVPPPIYYVLSKKLECADCSVNGSTEKPEFWDDPPVKSYIIPFSDETLW